MALLTTLQVAGKLGISVRRVQELVNAGRLPAQQFGRTYVIEEEDLKLVAERKPGRPRKPQVEKPVKKAGKKGSRISKRV